MPFPTKYRLPHYFLYLQKEEILKQMEIYIIKKKLGSRKELGRNPVAIDETANTLGTLLYILTQKGLTEAQTPKENHALSDSEIAKQIKVP